MNWTLIILIALLFSAFFSGMEVAFVSSNKVRAELDMKRRGLLARILGQFYGHEEMFISTMLVGNNIAVVVCGMGMAALLEPVIAGVWNQAAFVVTMQILLSALLILLVGEFLPKTLFRIDPNATMRFFSPLVWLFYVVLYPISKFTSIVSKGIMRLGGVKIVRHSYGSMMSKLELDSFIQKSIDESDSEKPVEPEMKIFQNALDFSNVHLRDCMIPRTELVAVDIDEVTVEELLQTFIGTGLSKVVVYRENIDNILGYIHSSEMFKQRDDWRKSIRPAVFAPESMLANKLMRSLMQQKKSLAIVVAMYNERRHEFPVYVVQGAAPPDCLFVRVFSLDVPHCAAFAPVYHGLDKDYKVRTGRVAVQFVLGVRVCSHIVYGKHGCEMPAG